MTQTAIAKSYGVNTSTISRALERARDTGVVKIFIDDHGRLDLDHGAQLVRRFGLRSATVVSSGDVLDPRTAVASAAAGVILQLLPNSGPLGITWGDAVACVVEQLSEMDPLQADVVQLAGTVDSRDGLLAEQLAVAWDSVAVTLPAPFIVETPELATALRRNSSVREAIEAARRVGVALVGIGSLSDGQSALVRSGQLEAADLERAQSAGAIGDVGGHIIDVDGAAVEAGLDDRLVGARLAEFLSIERRIGVAYGTNKQRVVEAALTGGLLTDVVLDQQAAPNGDRQSSDRNDARVNPIS